MTAQSFITFTDVWRALGPEVVLTAAAFLVMIIEFAVAPRARRVTPWLSLAGTVAAGIVAATRLHSFYAAQAATVTVDDFSSIFMLLILLACALVLLLAIGAAKKRELPFEYSYMMLFATVGALILTAASDLVTLYIGLELLSISSYVLVAMYRGSLRSAEGGIKYLVIGSIGSALILYGLSFVYGLAGTTQLLAIAANLQSTWVTTPALLYVALVLIVTGVGVKMSVAPFHQWTADVYEGAPTPVTAYLAVVSKAAVLALTFRLLLTAFGQQTPQWWPLLGWLAAITMIVGNVGGLAQRNVKRLLAFSSIGQVGYLIVPFAAAGVVPSAAGMYQGLTSSVYYLVAYALMTIGAFAVFQVVADARASEDIEAFTGLYKRSPWLAGAMLLFLLSLAGMPLTGGFVGKFLIFLTAFNDGQFWLGVILFATSAVAFYYYFAIVRAMFTRQPPDDQTEVRATPVTHAVVALCAVGTLLLGVLPSPLLSLLGGLHWFS